MTDTPWTKGPWYVSTIGLTNAGMKPVSTEHGAIAWVHVRDDSAPRRNLWQFEDEERDANANLIAAAPDMAEALSKIIEMTDEIARTPMTAERWAERIEEVAVAALSKARGEQ